jgi:hypothetical protein
VETEEDNERFEFAEKFLEQLKGTPEKPTAGKATAAKATPAKRP